MSTEPDDVFSSVHWDHPSAPKASAGGSELDGEGEHVARSGADGDAGPAASTSAAAARPFPAQRALSVLELRPDGFIQVRWAQDC